MTLSIVTPTKNPCMRDLKRLGSSINNLADLAGVSIEWIIVDYNSTHDEKLQIKEISKEFSMVDLHYREVTIAGVYHAYNDGFQSSKGEWVLFVGSDDYLIEEAASESFRISRDYRGVAAVLAFPSIRVGPAAEQILRPNKTGIFLKNTIPHPSAFISGALRDDAGCLYDESYKIASDYKLFLGLFARSWGSKIKTYPYSEPIIVHSSGGLSADTSLSRIEIIKIQKEITGFSLYSQALKLRSLFGSDKC